jgi:flagella basal body P-ring formation protein FlgA
VLLASVGLLTVMLAGLPARQQPAPAVTAAHAMRAAVAERLGSSRAIAITVDAVELPAGIDNAFIAAVPDPGARLGGPMRFRLLRTEGRPVTGVASVHVTGERVVTRQPVGAGELITADAVEMKSDEWSAMPLRRLPSLDQVVGGRARRTLPAGTILIPGHVTIRRAVEPGDRVTAVAVSGVIEVTASLVATDGGEPGEVIRVINPDSRRDLRARVVKAGLVEVSHVR